MISQVLEQVKGKKGGGGGKKGGGGGGGAMGSCSNMCGQILG
jgi:hypothetical protein